MLTRVTLGGAHRSADENLTRRGVPRLMHTEIVRAIPYRDER